MTTMGRYRYWGDQKPDTSRPLLTVTRPSEAVTTKRQEGGSADAGASVGTLRIYGPIDSWGGYWGVSAKEVAQALDLLGDVDRVVVRVNSPGGESSEGRAIMNLLRAHTAETTSVVDGGAYSAASYIAVGCDERVMSPGTTLMIHDTSTIIYGNADALRKQADVLDTISNSGAELYADVAGGTIEEWRERQKAETWYTAAGALEAGLIDRVGIVPDAGPAETAGEEPEPVESDAVDDRAKADYDLSLFDQGRIPAPLKPPTASAGGSVNTEGGSPVAFNDTQEAKIRELFDLTADADEAAITAAIERVTEKVTAPEPKAVEAAIPPGHVVVPQAKLETLEAGSSAGAKALQKLHEMERESFLDDNKAKYPAKLREAWAKQYDLDPAAAAEAMAEAPDLIPVETIGHAEAPTANDAVYASVWGDDESKGA